MEIRLLDLSIFMNSFSEIVYAKCEEETLAGGEVSNLSLQSEFERLLGYQKQICKILRGNFIIFCR